MEKLFNLDADFVRNQLESKEIQHDSNTPCTPEENFLEALLDGAEKMLKDKEAKKIFNEILVDGSGN